jgi:hypothetical protein
VLVGGILASVIPGKVKEQTGITPIEGCLNCKSLCDDPPIGKTIDALPWIIRYLRKLITNTQLQMLIMPMQHEAA